MVDGFIAHDLNCDDLGDFRIASKAAVSKISHKNEVLKLGSLGAGSNIALQEDLGPVIFYCFFREGQGGFLIGTQVTIRDSEVTFFGFALLKSF